MQSISKIACYSNVVFLLQYGQIHVIVRSLVNEKFGKEIWKKIMWVLL